MSTFQPIFSIFIHLFESAFISFLLHLPQFYSQQISNIRSSQSILIYGKNTSELLKGYFWALSSKKLMYLSILYFFIDMTTLESFKKTLIDLFDWSSKPQPPNNENKNHQNVFASDGSGQNKNSAKYQSKNDVSDKNPESEAQNQRKNFSSVNPMIHYIKTILIEEEVECAICLTKYKKPGLVKIGQCSHEYCSSCLRQYVGQRLKAFDVLKCPEEKCQGKFSMETAFYKSLSAKQKNLAQKIQKFHYTSGDPYLRMCPTQNCEGIVPVIQGQGLKCPLCHNEYCRKCMYLKHSGKCTKNQVNFLNAKYHYRKCGRCSIIVQKTQACNHITCKCGYEFCYGCGRKWPGNGHHCNPTRVVRPENNGNRQLNEVGQQNLVGKLLKVLGQIIVTMILIGGVALYGGICLIPMMLFTLLSGVIVGILVYSFKFVYEIWKTESVGLTLLLVIVFPLAMGFGVYNAFKQFWWDAFLFWWEILRQAIEKPLGFIWDV